MTKAEKQAHCERIRAKCIASGRKLGHWSVLECFSRLAIKRGWRVVDSTGRVIMPTPAASVPSVKLRGPRPRTPKLDALYRAQSARYREAWSRQKAVERARAQQAQPKPPK